MKVLKEIKCVLVGDGVADKTSLMLSYTIKDYPVYVRTIHSTYSVSMTVDQEPIRLEICDTPGGEVGTDRLRHLLYPRTDIVLICFSLVHPTSFDNFRTYWCPEVRRHCSNNTPIILVGTNLNLREDMDTVEKLKGKNLLPITYVEGVDMGKKISSVKYLECSALTREGLDNVFQEAVRAALFARKRRELIIREACNLL